LLYYRRLICSGYIKQQRQKRESSIGSKQSKPDLAWRVRDKLWFIGALAKLRKATIGFFISGRLFAHMEQLGYRWTDFSEISYLNILRKSVEKFKFH
jgi:hypothetical protein